jgi:adenylyl-sulfate kinase
VTDTLCLVTATRTGLTLWLTGLPGAGKTTLSRAVRDALQDRGHRVEILDGDEIRQRLSPNLGYSRDDRDAHVRRVGYIARLLSRNGVIVIVAAVSPYRSTRQAVRMEHERPFVEVFVDCPLEEVVRRDPKGLYARARSGSLSNLTGIGDPYEAPEAAEVVVETARATVEECRARIVDYLDTHVFPGAPD